MVNLQRGSDYAPLLHQVLSGHMTWDICQLITLINSGNHLSKHPGIGKYCANNNVAR